MSLVGSQAIVAAVRRFWWAVPIAGLLVWALILRGNLAETRAALSAERFAHQRSALNWQLATATALAADLQHRIAQERRQAEESRRIEDDYEARIADARARAAAVGLRGQAAAADQGSRGGAPVPGLSDPARGAGEAAGQDRLSAADALIATEQAIQLDALIDWIEAQARVAGER
ncbi:hypothetical protein [Sphingopyxis macrogoltabida]|uniref:Uncharacterized protein n=1 Tax=Sphingopyxis macrogoltabida TaxID=33050 RepID=A0AAC9FFW5_SPHMC|nr:hypothetical protein [Sphingopyxis macrogoltabida]ALJ14249.1 hypothetical protein LH19_15370 [Sphingopyxis macrogoltabida]AMU90515.1 hypothetical protein ATM17_15945 [Sphingopyxis macrogoltabida]